MEKELIKIKLLLYKPKTSLTVICKSRVVKILFESITHIGKDGNDTVIYSTEGEYRTALSLQDLLRDLPVNEFFKVHPSNVVALRYVTAIRNLHLKVNDQWVPMSAYFKKHLVKALGMMLDRYFDFFE